jgi:hypothetical protein
MASFVPLHGSWCWFKVKARARKVAREGARFGRKAVATVPAEVASPPA